MGVGADAAEVGGFNGFRVGEVVLVPHPVRRRASKVNATIVYRIGFSLPFKLEPKQTKSSL